MDKREQVDRESAGQGRYRWPWFLLIAVVLAFVLAVLWMNHEVQRTKRIRDANVPPPALPTNSTPAVL